jgi:hypothetical protein
MINIPSAYLSLSLVVFVFVTTTDQAGPVGDRLKIYQDSSCTQYRAESHMALFGQDCVPSNCTYRSGYYITLECSVELTTPDEAIGVTLYGDSGCNTFNYNYFALANSTGICFPSAQGYNFILTTNECPNRTVVDVYQFFVNGNCQTQDRHWDGYVGQCTAGISYYAKAICPAEPTPVAPPADIPVSQPVDTPVTVETPVTTPALVPVKAPIGEPIDSSQPVKAPKARLSSGSAVWMCFTSILSIALCAML